MDLSPIYELRSRLRTVAIAGTELLEQDYRLKRVLEAMKPLESVSPVFAKIVMLVRKLLAPNCPDRVGFLMEALSLTDALLCTQGAVGISGALEELPHIEYDMKITNISYSVLHPLLDALQNSGGGRYSYVLDMHKEHPELFEDYRIRAAMVQALGASYAELADMVGKWLIESGPSIVPLLKEGFDAMGKREMLRRVQIIDAVCQGDENEFYREQILESEKTIRGALIFALRHCEENRELLTDLTRTERGKCKQAAVMALEYLDGVRTNEITKKEG